VIREFQRSITQAQLETLNSAPIASFIPGIPGRLIVPIRITYRYTLAVAYAAASAPSLRFDALPGNDITTAISINTNGAPGLKYNSGNAPTGFGTFTGTELIGSGLLLRSTLDLAPGGSITGVVQISFLYAAIAF
jgi:hypothetical protein